MIYDYKSKSTVQDVILDSIEKLTYDIEDEFTSLRRYQYLLIYTPAFIAREIIGEILDDEDDVWVSEDSHSELLHDDDNEVLITLAYDGMIFVEEARSDFGTLVSLEGCALSYIYDGFSKRDVDCLTSEGESVLVFGFDEGVLDEFEHYEINGEPVSKEEFDNYTSHFMHDKKPVATSTTKSTYKINGKECSKEEFDKKYEEFEEMYLDNIRDMLLNYCEFMDSVNDWRSRMLLW